MVQEQLMARHANAGPKRNTLLGESDADSDKDNGGEGGAKEEEEEEKEEHVADGEEVKEQVRDDERLKAGSGKRFRFGAVAGFVTKLRNSARKSRGQTDEGVLIGGGRSDA